MTDDEVFPQPRAGVPLASLTTLGVGGAAQWFVRATSVEHVASAYHWCGERNLRLFVMGGGSNLVIADRDARLRVMKGPQCDDFHPSALDTLQRTCFTISPQSNRMGYRLTGGTLPEAERAGEMASDATVVGAVQVPPSGQPILLMADRQTTGGYPQIAVVITADIPLAAQLAPGDWVEFRVCSRSEALSALVAQEARLLAFD